MRSHDGHHGRAALERGLILVDTKVSRPLRPLRPLRLQELREGPLILRHEAVMDRMAAAGEISGHYHPKAAAVVRGKRISARCFAGDGRRMILPAFGAYAGGLNVLDPAIAGLLHRPFQTWMLGTGRLFPLPSSRLSADNPTRRDMAARG